MFLLAFARKDSIICRIHRQVETRTLCIVGKLLCIVALVACNN